MTARPPRSDGDKRVHGRGGWRSEAEARHGRLVPHPSPTLTASEIGSFGFCPQAWYLQRCQLPVTEEARCRREAGTRAHRAIGRRTDLVRAAEVGRWLLLALIVVLVVLLAGTVLRGLP